MIITQNHAVVMQFPQNIRFSTLSLQFRAGTPEKKALRLAPAMPDVLYSPYANNEEEAP